MDTAPVEQEATLSLSQQTERVLKKFLESCGKVQNFEQLFLFNTEPTVVHDHPLIKDPKTEVLFTVIPTPDMSNVLGTVHGGVYPSLIDSLTSLVAYGFDRPPKASVSVSINTQYMRPLFVGKKAYFVAKVSQIGRKMIFLRCDIYDHNLKLAATGSHEKMKVPAFDEKLKAIGFT